MNGVDQPVRGMQRIFLTGLSGVGKTTIGQRTASLLGWSFIDTDDVLAERIGMPVGQVLVEYGEPRFRELESEVLRELGNGTRVVRGYHEQARLSETKGALLKAHGKRSSSAVGFHPLNPFSIRTMGSDSPLPNGTARSSVA